MFLALSELQFIPIIAEISSTFGMNRAANNSHSPTAIRRSVNLLKD